MADQVITNAAPLWYPLGINDQSTLPPFLAPAEEAIHTPVCFLYTQWGPEQPLLVQGDSLNFIYGDETLNLRGKYANHSTVFADLFTSLTNPVVVKRIVPHDVGPKASLRVWVDVLETEQKEIVREVDGSFKRNERDEIEYKEEKIPTLRVKFFTEVIPANEPDKAFGKASVKTGTMTDTDTSTNSKMYPLFDIEAPFYGEYGNKRGLRLWAPTSRDVQPLTDHILTKGGVHPFRMALVERNDAFTSSRIVETEYAEKYIDFVLKPDFVDYYNKERSLDVVIIDSYQNTDTTQGLPPRVGPVGTIALYQDNIEAVLKLILEKEKTQDYIGNTLKDLSGDEDFWRVNLFGLQQPDGIPYQATRFDQEDNDGIRFTSSTDHFMGGAYDGTMNDDLFDAAVLTELNNFGDPNHPYQDYIGMPCTYFWDSGFGMEVKYRIGKFMANRVDTIPVASTYIHGDGKLSASEEIARHTAIIERLRAYGGSPEFGTPSSRSAIISRSGKMIRSSWRHRVPCTYELAAKWAKYAGQGQLYEQYSPSEGDNNVFEYLTDVNAPWVAPVTRNKDWAAGSCWPEKKNKEQFFFPALHTIYPDDTSVLTSLLNNTLICDLQRRMFYCHKEHTGTRKTEGVLKTSVEEYMREVTAGRYGRQAKISFTCFMSDADERRQYSWSLKADVYQSMMRTVQRCWVNAHNIDLAENDRVAFFA